MNAFANWLFSLLLGWTSGLSNRLMNRVADSGSAVSGFFARYWLPLLLLLLAAGTLADLIVWFLRKRPDHAWRQRFQAIQDQAAARALEQAEMPPQEQRQLAQWASAPRDDALAGLYEAAPQSSYGGDRYLPGEELPPPGEENPYARPAFYEPLPEFDGGLPPFPAPQPPPEEAWQRPSPYLPESPQASWADGSEAWQQPAWEPGPEPQADPEQQFSPYRDASFSQEADPTQEPYPAAEDLPSVRRRRSERHQRRGGLRQAVDSLRERLAAGEEVPELESLPPPIRRDDAFYEPVFPQPHWYQDPSADPEGNGARGPETRSG